MTERDAKRLAVNLMKEKYGVAVRQKDINIIEHGECSVGPWVRWSVSGKTNVLYTYDMGRVDYKEWR